jgi:hypothetical protein
MSGRDDQRGKSRGLSRAGAVQFIESSVIGVRAACLRLSAPDSPDVYLFPMIHVGSPAYYSEVKRRLDACDVVLFEGVRSFRSWLLTRAYAIATYRKRLGLVLQRDALVVPLFNQRKIHADVTAGQFSAAWGRIPLYQRALLLIGAPLYGFWLYLTGSRHSIGRGLNTEELESHRDYERFEAIPEFENVIATTRDARLVEEVSAAVEKGDAATRIGIVYGAAHMRVVSRLLTGKYGYRVTDSEWVTVFDYSE